jgi:ubiquinone/menaquinone biosynthesis C-methylase UbiE
VAPSDSAQELAALYDRVAVTYDTRLHADRVALKRLRIVEAPLRFHATGASRVLDLGCGTGRLAVTLSARDVIGIDISRGMLREAAAKGVRVTCADAHSLPFADETFDVVLAANAVFRHLHQRVALRECARVLRSGGRLACHQYSARVWSLWRPLAQCPSQHARDLESISDLELDARRRGLRLAEVHLWRGLRVWPHIFRVPRMLAKRLWDHGIFVFEKDGARP